MNTLYSVYGNGFFIADFSLRWDHTNYDTHLRRCFWAREKISELFNEILDLSKVEAGRMELELATFDLPLAIDNARTFVRERATKHGINLEVSIDERLGDYVGDERKIKQILLNLLSNAVKFTPEGGRIGIHARQIDRAVEISVSDTGIGISPEDQPKIFEEFRQVESDYAHKKEGTGLGLTLAKKFVELHGGKICVESEVGKGSIFTSPCRRSQSPTDRAGTSLSSLQLITNVGLN